MLISFTIFSQYLNNICTLFCTIFTQHFVQYLHHSCTIFARYLYNNHIIFALSVKYLFKISQYLCNIYSIFEKNFLLCNLLHKFLLVFECKKHPGVRWLQTRSLDTNIFWLRAHRLCLFWEKNTLGFGGYRHAHLIPISVD